MKKTVILAGLLIFLAVGLWGQDYLWTGSVSDDWTTAGNWYNGTTTITVSGVPTSMTFDAGPPLNLQNPQLTYSIYINSTLYSPNNLPYINRLNELYIINGTLTALMNLQCNYIYIEGGTLIRNGQHFVVYNELTMTSGILDLNGTGNVEVSSWDITGGILIRDGVGYYNPPSSAPVINNDNVIDIGGGTGTTTKKTFIWTGASNINWNDPNNWVGGVPPSAAPSTDKIIINNSTKYPAAVPNIDCDILIIANGAELTLGTANITIDTLFENKGTLNAGSSSITISAGTWDNGETFNRGTSTVILSGVSTVKGDNTFFILNCTNATVEFENGTTQQIINQLIASGASLDAITKNTQHWFLNVNSANVASRPASIARCASSFFLNWGTGSPVVTDGGNNRNVFTNTNTFTWTGSANSTNWNDNNNWDNVGTPMSPGNGNANYIIIIPSASYYPVYQGTGFTCNALEIGTGGTLDIGTGNLTVGSTNNNGNLIIAGVTGQTANLATIAVNNTVTYNSAANGVNFAGLTSFTNLTIVNGDRTGVGAVTVSGNFRLEGGSLSATSISVSGTSYIAGNVTTATTQTYTGAVTLGGDIVLKGNAGSTVLFSDTVNGTTSARALSIKTANVTFNGIVGGVTPTYIGSITVDTGTTTINANITTTGNQSYGTGTVTITGTRTLTSTGGSVTASGVVTSTAVTVLASQGITLSNTANVLSGNITLNNNQTGITPAGNITFYNNNSTVNLSALNNSTSGDIIINKAGALSIISLQSNAARSISIEATGVVTQTGAITTGTLTLAGGGSYVLNAANSVTTLQTGTSPYPSSIEYINNKALIVGDLQATGAISIETTVGGLTQTGAIIANTLTVNAAAGILLTSANKIITSVNLTNTAGNIEFVNENTGVLAVTVSTVGNVTIKETAGGLNVNDINAAVSGNITLEAKGNIGSISLGKLNGNGITVNAGGSITLLDITGNVVELNAGYTTSLAHRFFGTPGTVTLTELDATKLTIWCMGVFSSGGTKTVSGNVDLHTDNLTTAGNFLSSFKPTGDNELRPTNNFVWGNAAVDTVWTNTANWEGGVSPGIGNAAYKITIKASTASTDPVFSGASLTCDTLTIESGASLDMGTFNLTTDTLANNGNLILTGSVSQTVIIMTNTKNETVTYNNNGTGFAGLTSFTNLTIVNGGRTGVGDISVSGNFRLESGSLSAASINVTTGTSYITGNVNTTGIQTYTGAVELAGGARTLTGTIVTLGNITGAGNSLTITGNGVLNGGNGIGVLSVSGTTAINASITTTGDQTYSGSATLGGNVVLEGGASSTVWFKNTVNGSTSARALSIKTADVIFDGIVGAAPTFIGSITVDTGATKINTDITTTGNQNYGSGSVTITGARTLTSGGGITIGDITGTNTVRLEANANITIGGEVTAYQLLAIATNGTVSVNKITTTSINNDGLTAAIYIEAVTFVVTPPLSSPPPYSIVPGGIKGQLCLNLVNPWADTNNVVDGPEDDADSLGSVSGARWHQHKPSVPTIGKILYSFTEDSTGNGRLDRIRVQTNVALSGGFSGFDVNVEEYEINRTQGTYGFQVVPSDNYSFYIYLKEKPEIDGGSTPLWSITKNESLTNAGAKVGDPAVDINLKPIDTIPPRIAYTLTLPDYPQTYMRMSESVVSSTSASVSASFGSLSVVDVRQVEPDASGYLFNLSGSLNIDDLVNLDIDNTIADYGYFEIDDIVDKGSTPSVIDPAYPPKYPKNWGYTEYGSSGPVFTPPNKLLTVEMIKNIAKGDGDKVTPSSFTNPVIRRVTDVLVSRVPSVTGDDNYFAWPVWARFKTPLNTDSYINDDVFWGQKHTDTGVIWQFDGTNYLETSFIDTNDGIEIQARINNNLTVSPVDMELFWTTADVPVEYRNPKEAAGVRKAGGLWLPNILPPPLYNYVPMSDVNRKQANNSSSKLFNYDIAANGLVTDSSAKFEFIFRLSNTSDMFAARLDIPRGAVVPANWYTLVRPFVFEIQNMRRQRGGVIIMNNVINSNNREVAFIRYHLTRPGRITVQVYTLDGTLVKSLRRNEQRDTGEWTEGWDGTNNGGRAVARGMYFVRVIGPDIDEIRKIMVIK